MARPFRPRWLHSYQTPFAALKEKLAVEIYRERREKIGVFLDIAGMAEVRAPAVAKFVGQGVDPGGWIDPAGDKNFPPGP